MRLVNLSIWICLWISLTSFSVEAKEGDADSVRVVIETTEGSIEIAMFAKDAPVTTSNFLRLADGNYLDGGSFYRVITQENDRGHPKIVVVQGGRRNQPFPFNPIVHESTEETGIRHKDGTISMARGNVGSATSEFFICIGNQPGLDHGDARHSDGKGFAAFGRVTNGMSVVKRINLLATQLESPSAYTAGQMLAEPVEIISVRRTGPFE